LKKLSNTKNSSTERLPKLERLLLDADVNPDLIPLLRAVGFHAEFAPSLKVNIRNDRSLLRWARKHRYILVCHDKFKDRQTRIELYPELYHRGGQIIQIGGGPAQDSYMALGKLLVNRNTWLEWFKEHQGYVLVHSQGIKMRDATELYTIVQSRMPLETEPVRTLKQRETIKRQRKRRITPKPVEQEQLPD
jgi:hypothetical protein